MTPEEKTSRIPGFYKLQVDDRIEKIAEYADLEKQETQTLRKGLLMEDADRMAENVVSTYQLPLGMAVNFQINGSDYIIPMATEESSVVAAASHAAKLARKTGGFMASSTESVMRGQIQILTTEVEETREIIQEHKDTFLSIANAQDPTLVKLGGGARKIETKAFEEENMLVLYLFVDAKDAMGANAVNTMCEAISPYLEDVINEGEINFKIISNHATERLAEAEVRISLEDIGEDTAEKIVKGQKMAELDVYRAVTHNKGIMNGITAIALATGNDTRAIEAGAHAYASKDGEYSPLTSWWIEDGFLKGKIELPLSVGIVGGGTIHPTARLNLEILGVESARELSEVMASAGLAQNFAALRALAKEGIQRGHMKLHAKNIAVMAGAEGDEIEKVAQRLIQEDKIKLNRAKEILENL